MNLNKLRQDHVAILVSVEKLRGLVQTGVVEHADAVAQAIVAMSSAIKLHLAAEDRMLYPALVHSTNPEASRMGTDFQSEMGGLATAYLDFSRRWNAGPRITADPEAFKREANQIFKALHERIQREDTELYVVAERA